MKIINNACEPGTVSFASIDPGDTFRCRSMCDHSRWNYYIKRKVITASCNGVNLKTGTSRSFKMNNQVFAVVGSFCIEEGGAT